MEKRKITINEISDILKISHIGKNIVIQGLNYADAESHYDSIITYCSSKNYLSKALKNEKVKALITTQKLFDECNHEGLKNSACFVAKDPKSVFYYLYDYLFKNTNFYNEFDFTKKIGENCHIDNTAFIEEGVVIGNNVKIGPHVSILRGTVIKDNIYIGSNTVIGHSGMEAKSINKRLTHIEHAGGVLIEDDVHIGANNVICKSVYEGSTIIDRETQIDNMVHIAHNCKIGKRNLFAAGVITAGSVRIGNDCFIGVGANISNNVVIGNNVKVNIGAVVISNVPDFQTVAGFYAMPNKAWLSKIITEKRLYQKM